MPKHKKKDSSKNKRLMKRDTQLNVMLETKMVTM